MPIGQDGHVFADVLKHERVSLSDVAQALREADSEMAELPRACLEVDGQISILQKKREGGV